ncbi:GAF and ANTAR domain-containing protein [Streptomyces poonensis]|uniref:Transcriptional regulator n=1 Tax=Streptomyces poonensis TaxID=68255 RepID=A0A918Q431_9ACTN|nr:GAF and ANTAR domain-containing protein [Streptomyces poonensis]GGZ33068.1 transcriptional regulator [Streptomyces poonensis]GLJ93195.1 transcriptional regulator [Streptomyces poonensis]
MADKDVLFAETSRFATTLAALPPVDQVLHELARCGARSLGMRSAGVSLCVNDRPKLADALDGASTALGEAQERLDGSPCADALRTARPVAVADLTRAPGRWTAYEEVAHRFGVVALASVPLCGDGRVLGAVDLYDTAARPWPSHDLSAVRLLNDMATAYLAHSTALGELRRLADQLQQALTSRVVIEQAKGVISAVRQVSVDEAFDHLRQHTRHHRAKLHDTAREVVRTRRSP